MVKIVINARYGGFSLSAKARARYREIAGQEPDALDPDRTDPILVQVVQELGAAASSSTLHVVDVPDDVDWIIQDCDGIEWVAERHRTWL